MVAAGSGTAGAAGGGTGSGTVTAGNGVSGGGAGSAGGQAAGGEAASAGATGKDAAGSGTAGAAGGETGSGAVTAGNGAADSATPAVADGRINVNTADFKLLMDLPGIGEKKAQVIIDYRSSKGAFRSLSDLGKVKGIGPKLLEKLKPLVAF
ncbi:helix-hairpin-helix domain-containing protein [Paenibacillus tritici]|uniref:Helix-hairpin-helix domain-containing protein n=1 Tax=Paenibacillus tritici TaxID=1873425 RepID=A0ABX2DJ32_9BACL|nr:helix-hairpin-helix domain-containing protein [Paenibacillus tritici]